jgi:hypothetical protein
VESVAVGLTAAPSTISQIGRDKARLAQDWQVGAGRRIAPREKAGVLTDIQRLRQCFVGPVWSRPANLAANRSTAFNFASSAAKHSRCAGVNISSFRIPSRSMRNRRDTNARKSDGSASQNGSAGCHSRELAVVKPDAIAVTVIAADDPGKRQPFEVGRRNEHHLTGFQFLRHRRRSFPMTAAPCDRHPLWPSRRNCLHRSGIGGPYGRRKPC